MLLQLIESWIIDDFFLNFKIQASRLSFKP